MSKPLIPITSRQAYIYAAFLVMYEFLTYIANDMIMPGMLQVVHSFHGKESDVAYSLSAYILGGASLQLILGPLSDRYGRRPVMITGAILFFVCTIFIAFSQSMDQFLAARFFQGMGLCFIGVIGYATLQEIFAEMDAIRLISVMANVSITAPLIGPLLGALVVSYYSWRYIFVVIAALALITVWGFWYYMPEPVGKVKSNGELIKPVPLSFKIIFSNYIKLLSYKDFFIGSISLGLLGTPCVAWIALAPVILISNAHLSVIQYALLQIPIFAAAIMGNWYLHYLTTQQKSLHQLIYRGSLIAAVSLLLIFLLPQFFSQHYLYILPGIIIYFFGMSVVVAPLDRKILFSTPVAKGTASALMNMIMMSVQAAGVEVANLLYHGHNMLNFEFYCVGIATLYGIILCVLLKKSKLPINVRN
jgi:DHA1 family multidrug/chloramphenicol efflux transport protein-like MFS transporter